MSSIILQSAGSEVAQSPEAINFSSQFSLTESNGVVTVNLASSWTLTNTTTDNSISVVQNGNVGSNVASDGAVHITGTNTGIMLAVYTNIGAEAASIPIQFRADNSAFDQDLFSATHDGTGTVFKAETNGTLASNKRAVDFRINGVIAGTSGGNHGFFIYSNAAHTATGNGQGLLMYVQNDNASATNNLALFRNDGTGDVLVLQGNSSGGAHINFNGDPTNSSPSDGDFWFDGTNLKLRVGSTTNNIDMTAA